MDRKVIFEKLNEIFEDVLDLDKTPNLTDVPTGLYYSKKF